MSTRLEGRLIDYRIEAAVYNDLGMLKDGRHIPYLVGLIVRGPRGGMYMLDSFNTDRFITYVYATTEYIDPFVHKLCMNGQIEYLTINRRNFDSDRDIRKLAKEFGCSKALVRKEGLKVIQGWDKKVGFSYVQE